MEDDGSLTGVDGKTEHINELLRASGLVRPNNIREMHFSRNPKIAAYMHDYKLVKEFGEGVDRMFKEMAEAGQPEPEYKQQDFMVYATIRERAQATVEDQVGTKSGSSSY